jgi:hypothetical protein
MQRTRFAVVIAMMVSTWCAGTALAQSEIQVSQIGGGDSPSIYGGTGGGVSGGQIRLRGRIYNPGGTTFCRVSYFEETSPFTGITYQTMRVEIQRGALPDTFYTLTSGGRTICTVKTDLSGRVDQTFTAPGDTIVPLRAGDPISMNNLNGVMQTSGTPVPAPL